MVGKYHQIRSLISQNQLEEGIQLLKEQISQLPNKELQNSFIALERRYNQLKLEKSLGILTQEAKTTAENQLTHDLLGLLDRMEKGENDTSHPFTPSTATLDSNQKPKSGKRWRELIVPGVITAIIGPLLIWFVTQYLQKERNYEYTIVLDHEIGENLDLTSGKLIELSMRHGSQKWIQKIEKNTVTFKLAENLGADSLQLQLEGSEKFKLCQNRHLLLPNQENRVLVCVRVLGRFVRKYTLRIFQ